MTTHDISAPARWRNLGRTALLGSILLALLALCVAAGVVAGSNRWRLAALLLAAALAPLGVLALTQRFQSLVLALPLAALAVPFALPTGTQTQLPAALLLAAMLCGTWGASMLVRRTWTLAPWVLNAPMLVFSVICCVSLVWGIVWRDPVLNSMGSFLNVQIAALMTILVSMGAALLVGNFVKTERQLHFFVGCFVVFGALMAFTEKFEIPQHVLNDRGLWGLWTAGPAYGLAISEGKLRWRWRIVLLGVVGLVLYQTVIVNADWVSGWVPTLVGLAAITWLRSKKAFAVLLIVGVLAAYGSRGFFVSVADENINDGSLERIGLWEQNWRVVRDHWLFGTGPAGYAVYYMTYYRDDARSTHNNYLDILAQFGFTGMAAWLWLAVCGTVEGWRLSKRAPPGFLRALAIIATGGWVGAQAAMFFGDWVLPFAYNQGVGGFKYTVYTWLFLGTLLSIRQIVRQQTHQKDVAKLT